MEYSVRTAMMAVYGLLPLGKLVEGTEIEKFL